MTARTAAALLCLLALPAQAQDADERARRDLGTMFVPGAEIGVGSPFDATATATIPTRPFATIYPGLCGRNELLIGYGGPVGPSAEAQAKRVPFALGVYNYYYVLDLPDVEHLVKWQDYRPFEGPCARLTGKEDGWFKSTSPSNAAHGYIALIQALADIRARKRNVAGCRKAETVCDDVLEPDYLRNVSGIWRCASGQMQDCVTVGRVTFRMRYRENGTMTVDRIEYESLGALD